jgi:hypothetical protein
MRLYTSEALVKIIPLPEMLFHFVRVYCRKINIFFYDVMEWGDVNM